jgi:hypothetical protein
VKLKKYLTINKLSYRDFCKIINDPEKRKRHSLPLNRISHASIYQWTNGTHIPNLRSVKILQIMTQGQITIKDFSVD